MLKTANTKSSRRLPNLQKRNVLILISVLVVLALVSIPGVYFYNEYQKLKNPTAVAENEVKSLVVKVGKLIELPTGEDPTLATVSDKAKLADQPFFARAQNGDKVLIYTNNKQAILYRPSINKIIAVAPVNLGQNQEGAATQASGSATPTPANKNYKVALYNGTNTRGLTNTIETRLESKFTNLEVSLKENASKNDYKSTIVVNLSNDLKTANAIATELKGKVGDLPSGEDRPTDVDFLVILGQE